MLLLVARHFETTIHCTVTAHLFRCSANVLEISHDLLQRQHERTGGFHLDVTHYLSDECWTKFWLASV
jgi:hypothetical protein